MRSAGSYWPCYIFNNLLLLLIFLPPLIFLGFYPVYTKMNSLRMGASPSNWVSLSSACSPSKLLNQCLQCVVLLTLITNLSLIYCSTLLLLPTSAKSPLCTWTSRNTVLHWRNSYFIFYFSPCSWLTHF